MPLLAESQHRDLLLEVLEHVRRYRRGASFATKAKLGQPP